MAKRILIVEDNSELLELLRLSLKQAGFKVLTASNGVSALESARSAAPDLVVLDLVLPELDGFAVCEILRREPATSAIPIVILTGLSTEFGRLAGLASGADEYVMKPVGAEMLISKIKHLLRRLDKSRRTRPEAVGKLACASAPR